jgi:hypothetical protein
LLEAIVTLVIVSLIVAVLMQALGQSLNMRTRLLRYQREARVATLQEQWFRDTVGSALSDLPDALGRMDGSAGVLELVTVAPLGGGGLQRIRWSLQPVVGGYALHYRDATWEDIVVVAGPLQDAALAYLDHEGRWQREWKPAGDAEFVLPKMVRLEAATTAGTLLWLVPIAADPAPPTLLRPEELVDGI